MNYFEKQIVAMICGYIDRHGCEPTAILAWRDAYSRIKSDWKNVVTRKDNHKITWRGYEVVLVDAPGDRIVLDGNSKNLICEDGNDE